MRQLAWFHAVPEGSKKSRLASIKELEGDDAFLQFPELDGAEYMVALFSEAGLMLSSGMGPVPLSWQEIESWLSTTELDLAVWEKLTIKEMSEAYVAELDKSKAKLAVQPYVPVPENFDRAAVSSKIGSILRGFKKKPQGVNEK